MSRSTPHLPTNQPTNQLPFLSAKRHATYLSDTATPPLTKYATLRNLQPIWPPQQPPPSTLINHLITALLTPTLAPIQHLHLQLHIHHRREASSSPSVLRTTESRRTRGRRRRRRAVRDLRAAHHLGAEGAGAAAARGGAGGRAAAARETAPEVLADEAGQRVGEDMEGVVDLMISHTN